MTLFKVIKIVESPVKLDTLFLIFPQVLIKFKVTAYRKKIILMGFSFFFSQLGTKIDLLKYKLVSFW